MPMKQMLIDATHPKELRVALVDGRYLYELDIESKEDEQKKGNIYKGKITRIEPSLAAAFVDYGGGRHGFLPFKDIAPVYFSEPCDTEDYDKIGDLIKEGQELVVQVAKEERGNKGAALTTFISLAGCYLVFMPNSPRSGGISRRIEGADRDQVRDVLSRLQVPENTGVIIRTAGVGKKFDELERDLKILLKQWDAIEKKCEQESAPFLIHEESDIVIRAIRDHLRHDVQRILVADADGDAILKRVKAYVEKVRPEFGNLIERYGDKKTGMFARFGIERQINSASERQVQLPSGGAIVIDHTEALISIDVNSAKATKGGTIEETALQTNLEAASEIARQLRLRDLGGLIVVDFIDMMTRQNQRAVEKRMNEAMASDRARVQIGSISRFGLLEMSRQRLRAPLGESSQFTCPRCKGQGYIRHVESLATSIVRILEEECLNGLRQKKIEQIRVQLPVNVSTYLINEKRDDIARIEKEYDTHILLIPNPNLETPHYQIIKLRQKPVDPKPSHQMLLTDSLPEDNIERVNLADPVVAAASQTTQDDEIEKTTGFWSKLRQYFVEKPAPSKVVVVADKPIGKAKNKPSSAVPAKSGSRNGAAKGKGGGSKQGAASTNRQKTAKSHAKRQGQGARTTDERKEQEAPKRSSNNRRRSRSRRPTSNSNSTKPDAESVACNTHEISSQGSVSDALPTENSLTKKTVPVVAEVPWAEDTRLSVAAPYTDVNTQDLSKADCIDESVLPRNTTLNEAPIVPLADEQLAKPVDTQSKIHESTVVVSPSVDVGAVSAPVGQPAKTAQPNHMRDTAMPVAEKSFDQTAAISEPHPAQTVEQSAQVVSHTSDACETVTDFDDNNQSLQQRRKVDPRRQRRQQRRRRSQQDNR